MKGIRSRLAAAQIMALRAQLEMAQAASLSGTGGQCRSQAIWTEHEAKARGPTLLEGHKKVA